MNRRMAALRSVALVSASTYVEYALGLFISVWIARALGPADFGRYAFTVWLCGWLMTCSNHALTTSSTKFIAEAYGADSPEVASHISYRLARNQAWSCAAVIALFLMGVAIIRPTEWGGFILPITLLVAVGVVAKANYSLWVAISKGQEKFEPVSIATVISGVIMLALVVLASIYHAGLIAFVGIFTISCLTLNLVNRIAYRRYCLPFGPGEVPAEMSQRLTRHLRLTAVLILLLALKSNTVEVFLLNTYANSTAVGFFAIAGTLTRGAVELFSVGLTTTLLPYMARAFGKNGQGQATRVLSEATRFYWATGLMIAGLGFITTPSLVTLMYGNKYVDAIPAIEVTLVLAGLLLMTNSIAAFQVVTDRQGDRLRISGSALVINVILGFSLIPHFGLLGAVLCYAGTRLAELVICTLYIRRVASAGLPIGLMARLLVVGLVATGAGWLVAEVTPGHLAFVTGSIMFTVVFVPASFLVRYWSEEDYRLMGMITDKLGPLGRVAKRVLGVLQGPVERVAP
ncbi:oligosaccharide flippase family protein [Dyella telluris]|uniref:Oligosaccharide flippase family protein n=1 Tax=Dyella telluris TaxID=2763498 RepID=A0A7G8Q4C5_9GAMM|nr:oligosaccharide flippase family protein [Dyella telluris]QNK01633.1 oligosaccharide flippase family protein [Dyella telluris]